MPGAGVLTRSAARAEGAQPGRTCFSRAAVASFGGSGPYQMVGGLRPAAARRSGSGQANTFASLQMIQERWASSPRRALVTAGISIAVCGSGGDQQAAGGHDRDNAVTIPPVAATSAQGRFLIPSLRAAPMIVRPQIAIREQPADPRREGHFRLEFGVEMLGIPAPLVRLERGDVLVGEVLRPNGQAVPGAQASTVAHEKKRHCAAGRAW